MTVEPWGRSDWLAVCGLDCSECDIRRAGVDPAAAERVLIWFRHQGWLDEEAGMEELEPRLPLCTGCLGSRETHWAATCWILACCVDERGLQSCGACPDFPCERLVAWSRERPAYAAAFERLNQIHDREMS